MIARSLLSNPSQTLGCFVPLMDTYGSLRHHDRGCLLITVIAASSGVHRQKHKINTWRLLGPILGGYKNICVRVVDCFHTLKDFK